VGVARAEAIPEAPFAVHPTCSVICGIIPVDVKENVGQKSKYIVVNPKLARENQEKTGNKP
jgi:hypothetical protein